MDKSGLNKILLGAAMASVLAVVGCGSKSSSPDTTRIKNSALTTTTVPDDGTQSTTTVPDDGTQSTTTVPDDGTQSTTTVPDDGTQSTTTVPAMAYAVGDPGPAGGVIFFADTQDEFETFDFLEVAPLGWSGDKSDPTASWCKDMGKDVAGADETALGAGQANTSALVKAESVCGPKSAAVIASAYDGAKKDDWYLPSKDELDLLFASAKLTKIAGLDDGVYWSSSASNEFRAWGQLFTAGIAGTNFRTSSFAVRPIRSFK
ncbi:MAG: DUF1566 domain-containing protein [Ilumatobacteraceae bacterium]|nr:DUF1566 domain-containing protein [Ilumatobacteraceae bacterium]